MHLGIILYWLKINSHGYESDDMHRYNYLI